jgi:hypothetical protein
MDIKMIILIIIALAGLIMLVPVFAKAFKKNGAMKVIFAILGIAFVAYGIVGIGAQMSWYTLPAGASNFFLSASISSGSNIPINTNGNIQCPTGTVLTNGVCIAPNSGGANYQPTATYSGKNKYSTETLTGTSYYKVGSLPSTTTAQTNVNVGDSVTYWISNTSRWVQPVTIPMHAGVNPIEVLGYTNSTASVTLYDETARVTVTSGVENVSLSANNNANVEITYKGTSEGSAGPFGGLMVVEQNSTITQVTCTGDALTGNADFHLTYTPTYTTHVYKSFAYGPTLDDGTGKTQRISCQYKAGATAPGAGSPFFVKFIPANWYVSKAGNILLDTEKWADGDNTRTGSVINAPIATGYWA